MNIHTVLRLFQIIRPFAKNIFNDEIILNKADKNQKVY